MKLLYTLRHGSVAGHCGGDLRLFFTTFNASDWQPAPPPGMWKPPANAAETVSLPSGEVLTFSLYPVTNGTPGQLYLFGSIQVTTSAGVSYGPPMGQAGGLFVPNHTALVFLSGRNVAQSNGIWWDIGFELTVPWDGASADCSGHWWAIWH